MAETTMIVVLVAWFVACIAYFTADVYVAVHMVERESGINDDQKAKEWFLRLVQAASEKISIHDDGNVASGSIYQDPEVIDVIRRRLENVPGLRIECLFNTDENNLFRQQLEDHPRVAVRLSQQCDRVHFKIVDGGTMGYISEHALGATSRSYAFYDFSKVPWPLTAGAARSEAFGGHLQTMEEAFA